MADEQIKRYSHLFMSANDFETEYFGSDYDEPWVSYTEESGKVDYNKTDYEKLMEIPLTFDIISGGTIYWKVSSSRYSGDTTISYQINSGNWITITSGSSFTVNDGDCVQFKANNSHYAVHMTSPYNYEIYLNFSGSTCYYNARGNIMSLFYGENFATHKDFTDNYAAGGLFSYTNIVDASELVLPATGLTPYCYMNMFKDCTSLTSAPNSLPAKTLQSECYTWMFNNCQNLTGVSADYLPATQLAVGCYSSMFSNAGLTNVPNLPATEMAVSCYSRMFNGCSGITTLPEAYLPSTNLANSCYYEMFHNCIGLTNTPYLPALNLQQQCYSHMFAGCISLSKAMHILPAETLPAYCYESMFQGCTSLVTAPEIKATTLLSGYCCDYMFNGCTSLINVQEKLYPTELVNCCYRNMFSSCSTLVNAPELPAETLVEGCYFEMFRYCSSLKYLKCLATNISASNATKNWFYPGSNDIGTFVIPYGMELVWGGLALDDGIPYKISLYAVKTKWNIKDA